MMAPMTTMDFLPFWYEREGRGRGLLTPLLRPGGEGLMGSPVQGCKLRAGQTTDLISIQQGLSLLAGEMHPPKAVLPDQRLIHSGHSADRYDRYDRYESAGATTVQRRSGPHLQFGGVPNGRIPRNITSLGAV